MQDYARLVAFLRNYFVFLWTPKYLELKIYKSSSSPVDVQGMFFHSWSPVASTVYPSGLSRDFLNAKSAVPATPIRHIRNKAIIREGLEPIKGWELQLTEARSKSIVWQWWGNFIYFWIQKCLKKLTVHNTQFSPQISRSVKNYFKTKIAVFTWSNFRHIGVQKQYNGDHVDVPTNVFSVVVVLFFCLFFFLF